MIESALTEWTFFQRLFARDVPEYIREQLSRYVCLYPRAVTSESGAAPATTGARDGRGSTRSRSEPHSYLVRRRQYGSVEEESIHAFGRCEQGFILGYYRTSQRSG